MKLSFTLGVLFSTLTQAFSLMASDQSDPYLWLEELHSERSNAWVKEQNERTLKEVQANPLFETMHRELRDLYLAKDRVAFSSSFRGKFFNIWQDQEHQHGLVRRTSLEEYRKDEPKWDTIIDIDKLAEAEHEDWVYRGLKVLDKESPRMLLSLSKGGRDTTIIRELDYDSGEFIRGGFYVPEAKTRLAGVDQDHILIATDYGPGSISKSGYPLVVKFWTRGQPLAEAQTLFTGSADDMMVYPFSVRDGAEKHFFIGRLSDYYHVDYYHILGDHSLRKLPIAPEDKFVDVKDGYVYVTTTHTLRLPKGEIAPNSLFRFKLDAANTDDAELIFAANERQSIEEVEVRHGHVLLNILNNVRSEVLSFRRAEDGSWAAKRLAFPEGGVISLSMRDEDEADDVSTMTYTDYLTPSTQYLIHDEDDNFRLEMLKQSPARFDPATLEVVQHFAKSKDGVLIPYVVLKSKTAVLDGLNPTILYGYGGFEYSLLPSYASSIGKVWLARGGIYVIANIRGGGEFGPAWHQAALKEKRQTAYDDFIAVAEDLVRLKYSSPAHLGIKGGSNGGLLVGAVMMQRPDLFKAVLCAQPLLDMLRYTKLSAGSSWIGEYGDPDVAEERAYIVKYSPYQNIKAGQTYPRLAIPTSDGDDRVHPAHARKMAARMQEYGYNTLFYEHPKGGHTGNANLEDTAYREALWYGFLWNELKR